MTSAKILLKIKAIGKPIIRISIIFFDDER